MSNIKTAISIEEPLFQEVEALAEEMKISRSHIFSLAAREFIQRHHSQKLLRDLNSAYDDLPDPEEQALQRQRSSRHRQLVKDQW